MRPCGREFVALVVAGGLPALALGSLALGVIVEHHDRLFRRPMGYGLWVLTCSVCLAAVVAGWLAILGVGTHSIVARIAITSGLCIGILAALVMAPFVWGFFSWGAVYAVGGPVLTATYLLIERSRIARALKRH